MIAAIVEQCCSSQLFACYFLPKGTSALLILKFVKCCSSQLAVINRMTWTTNLQALPKGATKTALPFTCRDSSNCINDVTFLLLPNYFSCECKTFSDFHASLACKKKKQKNNKTKNI